jgi:hypothetical protein
MASFGDTVVAEIASSLYVFVKPATGWAGTITPTAHLTLPASLPSLASLAVSDSTIVAGGYPTETLVGVVFTKPAGGWAADPTAIQLTAPYGSFDQGLLVALTERTVVAVNSATGDSHTCPCGDVVYPLTPRTGGWPKVVPLPYQNGRLGTTNLINNANSDVTTAGSSIVVAAYDGTHIYSTTTPPTVTAARLTNIASTQPHLTITGLAGTGATSLRQITLHLPNSLQLDPKRSRQVTIAGVDASTRIPNRHELVLTLHPTAANAKFSIALGHGSLTSSPALQKDLRAVTRPSSTRRSIRTKITVDLSDAQLTTTTGAITITVS